MRRTAPLTPEQAGQLYGEHFKFEVEDGPHCSICDGAPDGRSSTFMFGVVTDFPTCSLCNARIDGKVVSSQLELVP